MAMVIEGWLDGLGDSGSDETLGDRRPGIGDGGRKGRAVILWA